MSNIQLTIPLPNINSPLARVELIVNGKKIIGQAFIVPPWNNYFQQISQAASQVMDVALTGSPFSITPNAHGTLIITGGTISNISLIRGAVTINLTGQVIIPIRISDTISITYSVAPTVQFLPD